MRATRAVLPFILACGPGLASADTYPRQPGIDVEHYVFRLTLSDESDEIAGDTSVIVRAVTGDATELVLDLTSASNGRGMQVTDVLVGGTAVRFEHGADRLRIPFSRPLKTGDRASVTIRYRGVPADGLRFLRNIHQERVVFSENWPNRARQWLPTLDHPSDKATGELLISAPAHYQVVANGRLVEETDLGGGMRRTHWRESQPIASWLFAIGVARFAVRHAEPVGGIPLQTWVFPQDRDKGYALFEDPSRRAIEFFVDRIGPYPYEKLANVQAAGIRGATEHASAIFYGEKMVPGGRAPIAHEIAHQWWGNSVTERDWDEVWLSEGFATYFSLLVTEASEGQTAFADGLRRSRNDVLEFERKAPDTPIIHRNLADMTRVLNPFVYQKGGWALHMLRAQVGTPAFWSAIKEYYRRYRHSNTTTAAFRRVVEEYATQDLEWFFTQWLTRAGVPRLEGTWRYDARAKRIEIALAQAQAGEPYRLPIEIGVVPAAGVRPRLQRVELRERRGTFSFPADAEPAAVVLDPDVQLLFEPGPFGKSEG